jgi:magnesium-protoporphyrin O-methyltransferase
MVQFLTDRGIEGATVVEVGGGAGEIQVELLKRGVARSVNLELSSACEAGMADGGPRALTRRRAHFDPAASLDQVTDFAAARTRP